MSKSMEDLQAAFAGESQANRKYLAYAAKAEKDGFAQAARLFRAAAAAETVHAHNHFRAMDGIKTTEENLMDAMAGENYEAEEMYPAFINDAELEQEKRALRSFGYALEVEKQHRAFYQEMLDSLEEQEEYDYYVCPVCGSTHRREAPETCPICGADKARFMKVS
jgi:rubrerythrin